MSERRWTVVAGVLLLVTLGIAGGAAWFAADWLRAVDAGSSSDPESVADYEAWYVVLDLETGREVASRQFRAGRGLGPSVMNSGLLVTQRSRCLSEDRRYEPGDSEVVAIDPGSGDVRWSRSDVKLDTSTESLGVTPDRGPVLVRDPASDQHPPLRALDPRDGAELWSVPGGADVRAANAQLVVLVERSALADPFALSPPTRLRALDRATGAEQWAFDLGGVGFVQVGMGSGKVVAATTSAGQFGSVVHVLDAVTGAPLLQPPATPPRAVPIVARDALTFRSGTSDVVDATTGVLLWTLEPGISVEAVAGAFLTQTNERPLRYGLLDARTGDERWVRAAGESYSSVLSAPGVLVLGGDGRLVRVAIDSGERLWAQDDPRVGRPVWVWTSEAIDARRLVITLGCPPTSAD